MEQFLRNKKELCYIDRQKYVELNNFTKYLGHDSIQINDINVLFHNNTCYITIELAEYLMKTSYNKNNPDVVQYHNEMGIVGMQYTTGTKTLGTVKSTFDRIGFAMSNVGTGFGYNADVKKDKTTNILSEFF